MDEDAVLAAAPDDGLQGHVLLIHEPGHHKSDEYYSGNCMFCDGGLSACTRCGAFEGAWPDDCPGEPMDQELVDRVYHGEVNYRDGEWREGECCEIMRPRYDLDNWMKEQGYARDADGRWRECEPDPTDSGAVGRST